MISSSTKDWSQAQEWFRANFSTASTFDTYCPELAFLSAYKSEGSLSFSVKDSDSEIFTFGLGPNPYIPENSTGVAVDRGVLFEGVEKYELKANWDSYEVSTQSFTGQGAGFINDSEQIAAFLKRNAPELSVWPGDPEIIFWSAEYLDSNLASIAAAVRWRSGAVMLASIATQEEFRGRGIAKLLVRKTLASLRDIDVEKVGLGVVSTNAAAEAVYEAIGFKVVREFSRFSRFSVRS